MKARSRLVVLGGISAFLLSVGGCPTPGNPGGGAGAGDGSGGSSVGGAGNGAGGGGGTVDGGGGGSGGGALNQAPTADLAVSPTHSTGPGVELTLDASGSSDPDGDALVYTWSKVEGPDVVFGNPGAAITAMVTPLVVENTNLTVRVSVSDGKGASASADASIQITVSAQFAGNPQSLVPYRESLTSDEAWHFLRRTEFGATPARVTQVVSQPQSQTIDQMFAGQPIPQVVLDMEAERAVYESQRWLIRMIEGPNPFHERMTMFWHDRFATARRAAQNYSDRNLPLAHLEMLRRNALGNYRNFLVDLTLDPLMLLWLDGANSPASAPNENYAREFWELFTLGRDILYTEQDIREAARGFTGITILRSSGQEPRPIYDLRNHDNTPKTIFPGRTSPANHDYESIIDLTLEQPEAARYVARNLFVFFVHNHPSDAVVQELAEEFVRSGFEIAPLVRRILRSQAFFSSEARGNQINGPVDQIVAAARTMDTHYYSEDSVGYRSWAIDQELVVAGHEIMNPPGVQGWGEDQAWLEEQSLLARVRALRSLMQMEHGPAHLNDIPFHLLPPVNEWTQREVRARIVNAMAGVLHLELTEEERDIYIEVLDWGGYRAFHLSDYANQKVYLGEMIRLMFMDERFIGS